MSDLKTGIESGQLPVVLYHDGTQSSAEIEGWLKSVGAKMVCYSDKSFNGPLLVVDGTFLGPDDLRQMLKSRY